jgi:CHAT domain-containing protein/tetratricopeptide (TPR) repeat protein
VTEQENHLGIDQIEWFLEARLDNQKEGSRSAPFEQASHHLVTCEKCQRLVSMHKNWDRFLHDVAEERATEATAGCPLDSELLELAAGIVPDREAEKLLTHVTQCSHCGPLLRQATAVFSEELSAEEQHLLKDLESGTPEWQVKLTQHMTKASRETGDPPMPSSVHARLLSGVPWWKTVFAMPRLLWSGALVAILALAAWFGLRMTITPDVNRLLANAYTEKRVIELRIPGAKYAPLRLERGTARSVLDRPQALLDANALISRKLRSQPDDPEWLDAKGRAELVDGNYKEAIKTLQRALDLKPDAPTILSDLASSYFQRAETEDRPIDYGSALDLLGKALAKSPDDTILLFNRAIVAERAFLFTQAIEDWEHYLRVDPKGDWASEATKRLRDLQEKLHAHEQGALQPLWDTSTISRPDHLERTSQSELDSRIEDYLHTATADWLGEAFPIAEKHDQRDSLLNAKKALSKLASVAHEKHKDAWLYELLKSTSSHEFPTAVSALTRAVRASDRGDFESATSESTKAAGLFRVAGNNAGELRARFEKVYSLQLSNKSQECLREAIGLPADLEARRYSWLHVQSLIERAICLNMAGDLAQARTLAKRASALALDKGYRSLDLRAISMASAFDSDIGNHSDAWHLAHSGLLRFWSESSPTMRGYNLYADLDEIAETFQERHLQVAIWRQATSLIASNPDTLLRAMAHLRLANAASEAHMPSLARFAFAEGTRLLNALPQNEATENNEIEASIWFARFEMANGDLDEAFKHLAEKLPVVGRVSTRYVTIDFYRTLGELQAQRGNLGDAQRSLSIAIGSAERGLLSLTSERDRQRWNRETSDAYRALVALTLRQGDVLAALEFWEWYRGAAIRPPAAGRNSSSTSGLDSGTFLTALDLNEIARNRPELRDESVVSYAVLPAGLAIWVFDNHGVQYKWVSTDSRNLKFTAKRFVELCSDPNSNLLDLQFYAKKLYRILITPIEDHISTDRVLVIEPDAQISQVPMQALMDQAGHYLGETHAILWSPGLYYNNHLRSSTKLAPNLQTLVVADPAQVSTDLPLPALTDALKEGRAVTELFRNSKILTRQQATWSNIGKELPGSTVFHFAGHAFATETQTGLMLAQDPTKSEAPTLLNSETLPPAWLQKTQLAVLSACLTEKGTEGSAFDPDSLAMVFMNAGVPHIVASRWNVDSNATAVLMTSFYGKLLHGSSVAESLRLTAEAIRIRPETAHPYYWAAFNLFGKT